MLQNREMNKILEKLETLDDEQLSVELLKKFNDKTSKLGKLLLNLDESLDNEKWKTLCNNAQEDVDTIVNEIMSL